MSSIRDWSALILSWMSFGDSDFGLPTGLCNISPAFVVYTNIIIVYTAKVKRQIEKIRIIFSHRKGKDPPTLAITLWRSIQLRLREPDHWPRYVLPRPFSGASPWSPAKMQWCVHNLCPAFQHLLRYHIARGVPCQDGLDELPNLLYHVSNGYAHHISILPYGFCHRDFFCKHSTQPLVYRVLVSGKLSGKESVQCFFAAHCEAYLPNRCFRAAHREAFLYKQCFFATHCEVCLVVSRWKKVWMQDPKTHWQNLTITVKLGMWKPTVHVELLSFLIDGVREIDGCLLSRECGMEANV